MLKISRVIVSLIALASCNTNNDNRSDFVAYQNSYVNKINLLKDDKDLGIKRDLKKVTEETVNTNENLHKKIVTINETLEMNTAKGDATAVLVFDSANKQRSGKRSITLSDDGTAFLGEFVKQFETSRYKSIPNDKFENLEEVSPSSDAQISQPPIQPQSYNALGASKNVSEQQQKEDALIEKIKKINAPVQPTVTESLDKILPKQTVPQETKYQAIKPAVKSVVTMKPVSEKKVMIKKTDNQIDKIVTNNQNLSKSPAVLNDNMINSVVLKPLDTKNIEPTTHHKPKPLHVWL